MSSQLLLYLVDCKWTEFSSWSSCSKSCGGGQMSRQKTVLRNETNGGVACSGPAKESRNCNTDPCSGKWWNIYYYFIGIMNTIKHTICSPNILNSNNISTTYETLLVHNMAADNIIISAKEWMYSIYNNHSFSIWLRVGPIFAVILGMIIKALCFCAFGDGAMNENVIAG